MLIVSKKDLRVATTSGSVVLFKADEPREVSDSIGAIALQMGAKQVVPASAAKAGTLIEIEEPEEVAEQSDSLELVGLLEEMIKEGDPKNFKADGTPKAASVNRLAGRTVLTEERDAAWEVALNS